MKDVNIEIRQVELVAQVPKTRKEELRAKLRDGDLQSVF